MEQDRSFVKKYFVSLNKIQRSKRVIAELAFGLFLSGLLGDDLERLNQKMNPEQRMLLGKLWFESISGDLYRWSNHLRNWGNNLQLSNLKQAVRNLKRLNGLEIK
jgi:hypothetical protein